MPQTPLHDLQKAQGATFADYEGWRMPRAFAGPAAEYRALSDAAGVTDRSHQGRLRLTGKDGLDLLHRVTTNALLDIEPLQGKATLLLTSKGRIIDLVFVVRLPDHLLLVTGPGCARKVHDGIARYIVTEDCALEDATERTGQFRIVGPRSAAALRDVLGADPLSLAKYRFMSIAWRGETVLVGGAVPLVGLPSYHVFGSNEAVRGLWREMTAQGVSPVGVEAYEALHIETGLPASNTEFMEDYNPLEAGAASLISFTKGCYVGQEVVARLNTYKKVQRTVVQFRFPGGAPVARGVRVLKDGRDIGLVTNPAHHPEREETLAIGFVALAEARAGLAVSAATERGPVAGQITKLLAF
ncbi:MAG: hypothetical protein Q7T26_01695 [Dehalococcoidia bacterium]|nr:hypothetical protein [Dehalococcoidia bacterium]